MINTANLQGVQNVVSQGIDFPSYLSGFFEGEGCFSVSFSRNIKYRLKWEVRPSVSVSQNESRRQIVDDVQNYFGCGFIRRDLSDKTVKWECRSVQQIHSVILPHFDLYPLITPKNEDVKSLREVVTMMTRNDHLTRAGIVRIVNIVKDMNPDGKRRIPLADILESMR